MRWLFVMQLRPYVLLAAAASLVLNVALLVPSLYMLQVFDRVFASRSIETLVMLSLLAGLALWLGYCMDSARARALASAGRMLDCALAPAALSNALTHAAAGHGRAESERLRDVALLRSFLGSAGVHALFDAPWLPVYLVVIGLMHPVLGATAALGGALLLGLAAITERLTRESAADAARCGRAVNRHADALTRNAEAIVGMGMNAAAIGAWRARHGSLLDAQATLSARTTRLSALARAARQAVQLLALGVGAWLVIAADASPGIMVAATILLGRALQPVEHLIGGWKQWVDTRAAWERIAAPRTGDVAGHAADHVSGDAADERLTLPAPRGRLEVERVVYAPDRSRPPLLKNVSFAIEAGESLGIVGASGSGKTTLLRLILGLRSPQHGIVRLDGADIAQWNRDELGAHVGYLAQDVRLFDATVAENIARLGPADSERVVEAARLAHAHDMILRLPQGYDTPVGEAVLSGGQRQRIGLARALYGAPKLVVLDEPNAHLDADGEAALRAALQELKERGTTVVVAGHRPGLLAQLDKLAVIDAGELAAFGPSAAVLSRLQGTSPRAVRRLEPVTTVTPKEEAAA